jgi:integrase/recombinase XerC
LEGGPLFRSFNRARKSGCPLSGTGLYLVVRDLGRRTGLRVWPHALRHASITEALDLTGGDVRAVQRFSRHRDVRVLQRYDDCRRDLAGEVARKVAAGRAG